MLAAAQTKTERAAIEEKMESDPELLRYLQALQATDKEDIVSEERARRQQARQSRLAADIEAMDMDDRRVSNNFNSQEDFVPIEICFLCEIFSPTVGKLLKNAIGLATYIKAFSCLLF